MIDTGLGLHDVLAPEARLSRFFLSLVSPDFREDMTAVRQIARLGFHPRDVQHIVLTHLERLSGRSAEVPAEKLVHHVPAGYATRDELRV